MICDSLRATIVLCGQLVPARSLNQDYKIMLIETDIVIDHKIKLQRFTVDSTNCVWFAENHNVLLIGEVNPATPLSLTIHKLDMSAETLTVIQTSNSPAAISQVISQEAPGAEMRSIVFIDSAMYAYDFAIVVSVIIALVVAISLTATGMYILLRRLRLKGGGRCS